MGEELGKQKLEQQKLDFFFVSLFKVQRWNAVLPAEGEENALGDCSAASQADGNDQRNVGFFLGL